MRSTASSRAVSRMTGMSSPWSRRRRQASAPSPPGSMRSRTSRSGA
ncbi:Uncharacterised protein [Bordetella pertussis]|nr:Uncharacterised protein [Bordetella pertussis]